MAGSRKPGSQCAYDNPVDVQDGTLCCADSPTPGTIESSVESYYVSFTTFAGSQFEIVETTFQETYQGVARGLQPYYEGALCIYTAVTKAETLAPDAVLKETGYELGSLLSGLIPGLLQMIAIIGATTFIGAGVGALIGFFAGGAGAVPGAVVGADIGFDLGMAVMTWLGVAFLAVSIAKGFGEMVTALQNGIEWAWQARNQEGPARDKQVDRAAGELARTVGILVRLILQGIVAYLLKKAAMSSTKGLIGTAKGLQTSGAGAVSDEIVADLVGKLRVSRLGSGFADWVDKNWRDLVKNPKLQEAPAEAAAGSGGTEASGTAGSKPPARTASADAAAEDKPDLSTNAKKGVFGEARADAYMKQKGFKKLNGPDVQVGDAPSPQGIDGIYEKLNPPPKYVVADAKFGSSRLGKTDDGMQMSENWVDNRLNKALGRDIADDIRAEGYDRYVLKVDESGNVTPKLVNEDAAGRVTLSDPPAGSWASGP